MKQLAWVALVLMTATPATAEPKQTVGFYRLATIAADGKKIDLADELKRSIKNQGGGKYETDFVRFTVELETEKLTIGIDQVMGERGTGTASHCRVRTSIGIKVVNGKFAIPSIEASANGGEVSVRSATTKTKRDTTTDTNTNKKTASCNASLDAGTFAIKGSGKAIELLTTDDKGKPVVLQLVADTPDVDLQARAVAFASK